MCLRHSGQEQLEMQSCKWRPLRAHFYCCCSCSCLLSSAWCCSNLHTNDSSPVPKCGNKKQFLIFYCEFVWHEKAEWRWSMQRLWINCEIVRCMQFKTKMCVTIPQQSDRKGVILENCSNSCKLLKYVDQKTVRYFCLKRCFFLREDAFGNRWRNWP